MRKQIILDNVNPSDYYRYIRRDHYVKWKWSQVPRYLMFYYLMPDVCITRGLKITSTLYEYEEETVFLNIDEIIAEICVKMKTCRPIIAVRVEISHKMKTRVNWHSYMLILSRGHIENEISIFAYDPSGKPEKLTNTLKIPEKLAARLNEDPNCEKNITFVPRGYLGTSEGIQNYLKDYEIGYCYILVLFVMYIACKYKLSDNVEKYLMLAFAPELLYNIVVSWLDVNLDKCIENNNITIPRAVNRWVAYGRVNKYFRKHRPWRQMLDELKEQRANVTNETESYTLENKIWHWEHKVQKLENEATEYMEIYHSRDPCAQQQLESTIEWMGTYRTDNNEAKEEEKTKTTVTIQIKRKRKEEEEKPQEKEKPKPVLVQVMRKKKL